MMELMVQEPLERKDSLRLVITLDGPAASGKSSVARRLAERLAIPYISSGLLYRAATYLVLREGQNLEDETGILQLLSRHGVVLTAKAGEENEIWLDGTNVSAQLHTDAVDATVSAVSKHAGVRGWVKGRLRQLAGSFVIDGRDMGTEVFPYASHKFYLDAPAEVRAKRRVGERSASLAEVTEAIRRRDLLDAAQLAPAEDAVHIDTAALDIDGVVDQVLQHVPHPA